MDKDIKDLAKNIEPVLINNKMYFIDSELYNDLLKDSRKEYIPKSKVKEKIELIKSLHEKIYYEENVVSILQELLEE